MPRPSGGHSAIQFHAQLLEDAFGAGVEIVDDIAQTPDLEQRRQRGFELLSEMRCLLLESGELLQLMANRRGKQREASPRGHRRIQCSSIPSRSAASRKSG